MKSKLLLSITCTLLFANQLFAQKSERDISQQTDSLLTGAFNKGRFSGLVAMTHDGQEFYFKQLGYANWETKRVIDRNTLFNIGSLNKQFTEEIIHQLVKENKLSYGDRLAKYIDLLPVEIEIKISVQELLD